MSRDARWMDRAIEMARRGLGTTAPNPSVGAVLVKSDRVIGEGFTRPVGGPHAEVVAIEDCKADAGGVGDCKEGDPDCNDDGGAVLSDSPGDGKTKDEDKDKDDD